jgi:hypothetical protein
MDEKLKKELESLKQSVASAQTQYNETKASPSDMQDEKMQRMCNQMDSLANYVGYVHSYASRVEDALSQHCSTANHIPPISGPGMMRKVLKALGMDSDYEVKSRMIYASDKNTLNVNLTAKLKT